MTMENSLKLMVLTSMVWSIGLDFFHPVRKYVMKRTHFKRFRRMLKDNSNLPDKEKGDLNSSCCPSCRLPFDKGKKRKLIDTCGHTRCYTCIFTTDSCPQCQPQAQPKTQLTRRPTSYFFPRQLTLPNRPNSISVDSKQQLEELAKQQNSHYRHNINPRKISGYGSRNSLVVSQVEVHSQMDIEPSENIEVPNYSFVTGNKIKKNTTSNKKCITDVRTIHVPLNRDSPGSLSSMPSQKDLSLISRQNLRSREQSVTSLMSISSRSSSAHTDILKNIDENEGGSRICNQRYSITQSSNISLDISIDIPPSIPPPAVTIPLRLKPLYFEVPQSENEQLFLGREWLFKEIEEALLYNKNVQGISIIGAAGTGKTSFILQLVDYSSFGRKWEETLNHTTQDIYWKIKDLTNTCIDGDQMSVSSRGSVQRFAETAKDSVLYHLASKVVGYHFCQAEYNSTCTGPDFIHSLAAQLCQAPQLVEYRNLLIKEPRYQNLLCLDACLADPDKAFIKGILEPLNQLSMSGTPESNIVLLVIDSIHEAEVYKSSGKTNIVSLLIKHLHKFPKWLKIIMTVSNSHEDLVVPLQLQPLSFDFHYKSYVQQDILKYIHHRINNSTSLQCNINNGKKDGEECPFSRFSEYLSRVSNGSFLYVKLTLDLLHQGHLVIKSSSFSVLPLHLNQVFLLNFNLHFPSNCSFEKIKPILDICLSSLYPLTILEVYHSLNARYKLQRSSWFEFLQQIEMLSSLHILVHRLDGSLMVSHPSLREWLTSRDASENKKFLCDARQGHISLALRMARLEAPLSPAQGLELAHHLIRSHIFGSSDNVTNPNLKMKSLLAVWLQHCLLDPSSTLVHERNIFCPDIEVSRLLLVAGANPNVKIGIRKEIPLLNLAADKGFQDFTFLLKEFGANCNVQNQDDGISPLMAASRKGHVYILKILLAAGAKVNLKDAEGKTALSHAAEEGYIDIVKILLKSQWPECFSMNSAINNAFVFAAGKGHHEVCEYLLSEAEVQVNLCDSISGHTALTFSCWQGHSKIVELLLDKGATVVAPSRTGVPPIIWAIRGAHVEIVQILLNQNGTTMQTDKEGKTSLMWAAMENQNTIMKMLLEKEISVNAKDFEGLTALAWASIRNSIETAKSLLDDKANIECLDTKGRTPLCLAIKHKDGEMVNLLLKNGANMEHKDYSGNSLLEEAVIAENIAAVSKLLHHGVKLGPKVWCSAQDQPNMLLILLHKLLSDGVVLYKKEKLLESSQRFQYALKKFPLDNSQGERKLKFQQLKFYLHLGLSRNHRKLKEYILSIEHADEALKIRPESYEALYVRAKAKHEAGCFQDALHDVTQALHINHCDARIVQTLHNLRADILTSSKVVCPLDGIEIDTQKLPMQDNQSRVSPSRISTFTSQHCRTLLEHQ